MHHADILTALRILDKRKKEIKKGPENNSKSLYLNLNSYFFILQAIPTHVRKIAIKSAVFNSITWLNTAYTTKAGLLTHLLVRPNSPPFVEGHKVRISY